jgi:hypothetical protein
MSVEEVRTSVTFTERRFRGLRSIKPGVVQHPVFGRVYQIGFVANLPIVDDSNEE